MRESVREQARQHRLVMVKLTLNYRFLRQPDAVYSDCEAAMTPEQAERLQALFEQLVQESSDDG